MNDKDNGRVEKLAEVGKHTLDLFHEMNNNFSVMVGMLEIINIRYRDIDPSLKQCLDKLHLYINRSVELVHNTLGNSRKEKKAVALSEINEIIKDTIRNLGQHDSFRGISFCTNLEHSFQEIRINSLEFEHILINLFNNSRDSILTKGKSGSVHIRTRIVQDYAVIEVADSGEGVTQKIQERIFDPFFTTKGDSTGAGLGLTKCREIVADSNGELFLDSEYTEGAKFVVKFPIY